MYEIELKVRLRVRDDDTTWIFDWIKSCLDLEESVEQVSNLTLTIFD